MRLAPREPGHRHQSTPTCYRWEDFLRETKNPSVGNPYIGIGISCTLWNDHVVFAETHIQTLPDAVASKA